MMKLTFGGFNIFINYAFNQNSCCVSSMCPDFPEVKTISIIVILRDY